MEIKVTEAATSEVVDTEDYVVVVSTVSLLGLLLILGAVANVILLLAFNRRPALRSISNRFVGNLLVVNLFSTLVLIPFVCLDLLGSGGHRREHINERGISHPCSNQCFLEEFASSTIAAASLLSTLLIALDQYLAILFPLRYHHLLNSFKAWILISIAWTLAFSVGSIKTFRRACLSAIVEAKNVNVAAFTTLPNLNLTGEIHDGEMTISVNETDSSDDGEINNSSTFSGSNFFSAGIFIAVFVLPSILLAFIYGRIYMEAHKNLVRIRREKINPVRTMFNTAIKITDRMGDPIKKKKKKKNPMRSLTLKPHNMKQSASQKDNLDVTFDEDEVTPLNGNTPTLHRHPPPGHLERSKTTGCLLGPKTPSPSPKTRHPLKRSHSQQLMHSIRHKLSNASQFMHRHKEEMHTARISLVSVILVLVCWLPYYVVGLFVDDNEPVVAATDDSDHLWITCFVDVMIALYTVLSPCVFAYRCKRLQREVGRLFRAVRRSEDHDLTFSRRQVPLHQTPRHQAVQVFSVRSEAALPTTCSPRPLPNFLLSTPTELPETTTTNSGGKFNCLPIPKLSRESPRPSISDPKRTLPGEISVFPVSGNIGDDSQRSSISSASGQSVTTQCTTAGTRTSSFKKSEIGKDVNHETSSKDDEDEGLILTPLLSCPQDVSKTNIV